ncbi:SpoIIE family protein phosphatase [Desulfococcaceae bacterium HSG8]|nr:SpoIIE family protein phosphatase [Desulfococcaceae bacterium HSG8]
MKEQEHRKTNPRAARARPRYPLNQPEPEAKTDPPQAEILAKMRHDLRTPLNAVIGYSEMLSEDAEELAGYEDFVSDISKVLLAGRESLAIVNNILAPGTEITGQVKISLDTFGENLRRELHTPSNAMISFTESVLKNAEHLAKKDEFIQESIPDLEKIYSAAKNFLGLVRKTEGLSDIDKTVPEQASGASELPPVAEKMILPPAPDETAVVTADSGNLLVVDDNEMNRELLSRHLKRQGHTVAVAENGSQALAMIKAHMFDVVLLDIMMPGVDGYQVLEYLKASEDWRNIPIIMISALDEMDSVVRCIEMGAEDYLPKPVDPVLLRARIGAVLEKKRLRDKEQLYLKSLEREMEIGRQIQAGFLPDALPQLPDWEIAARFHPAKQVSGDFYDAFMVADGRKVVIVMADVCGKGVGAALFMGLFRSLIRAFTGQHYHMGQISDSDAAPAAEPKSDHTDILKTVALLTNNYIAQNHSQANMFATIFLGMVDLKTGTLIYINGGHEPPAIVNKDGVKEQLEPTGPAVGMMPDMPFEAGMTQIELGDILVTFTDGITEAMNSDGECYSKESLFSLLSDPGDSADALLDRIEASLSEHTAGAEQSDDITLLAVRRSA